MHTPTLQEFRVGAGSLLPRLGAGPAGSELLFIPLNVGYNISWDSGSNQTW